MKKIQFELLESLRSSFVENSMADHELEARVLDPLEDNVSWPKGKPEKEIDEEEDENGLKIGDWRLNLSPDTESHHQTKHRVRVVWW